MKPQPASRSSFHFQMKCLAPCSRLTPGDLDDPCRTLKPSFRRIFPASARLLLDHVWTPCDLRIKWLPFQPTTENVNVIIVLSRSNSAHLHPARPARSFSWIVDRTLNAPNVFVSMRMIFLFGNRSTFEKQDVLAGLSHKTAAHIFAYMSVESSFASRSLVDLAAK